MKKISLIPLVGIIYFTVICSILYRAFCLLDFKKLVVINVLIYSTALLIQFYTLIRLSCERPDFSRRFCFPGG